MKIYQKLSLSLLLATSTVLSGCIMSTAVRDKIDSTKTISDNVRYIVNPIVDGQRNANEVIILGDKYSYKLTGEHIHDLEKLPHVLDVQYITAEPISFWYNSKHPTRFRFSYDKKGKAFNQNELAIVNKYCDKEMINVGTSSAKLCDLMFNVQVHEKYTPKQNLTPVKGTYPIYMIVEKNNSLYKALLPLAVVGDVITSPIQFIAMSAIFATAE